MIEPGQQAPDFTLANQDGDDVSLAGLRGRWVVLYFYPRAATPGCTVQACGVRDHRSDYDAAGATVLGVSTDPVAKLKAFHENEGLNFDLLSDEDHAVAESYGAWGEKKRYGKVSLGTHRMTFVIDPDGTVRHAIRKVSPPTHDEKVLAVLGELAV